jgi:hypothetical protein
MKPHWKAQIYSRQTCAIVPGFVCRNGRRGYKLVCQRTGETTNLDDTLDPDWGCKTFKTIADVRAFLWAYGLKMVEPEVL